MLDIKNLSASIEGKKILDNFNLNITMFRFFTVYGPWGRPDMALYKFTKGINSNKYVEVFNKGNMWRDFTYIDDLVESISRLIKIISTKNSRVKNDSLSKVCPFRIVNIGNQKPTKLNNFIKVLEKISKKKYFVLIRTVCSVMRK